jgi:genome maintenance exonuclease 1
MKTFIEINIPSINRITDPDGSRLYQTPSGNYPSVTTVTSILSNDAINNWKERVGKEESDRISKQASRRGTEIHELCEQYLKDEPYKADMFNQSMFSSLIPCLDSIDNIYCLESPLCSNTLRVAGTVDCIAEYNGVLSVIDFKTSKRRKSESDIPGYFMQCAAYAECFFELTGIRIKEICIIMGIDDDDPAVFKQPVDVWLKEFKKLRLEFYLLNTK